MKKKFTKVTKLFIIIIIISFTIKEIQLSKSSLTLLHNNITQAIILPLFPTTLREETWKHSSSLMCPSINC